MLEAELRRKILPSIQLVDVAWSHTRNELWLFSGSAAVRTRFEELFTKTFKLPIVARNAYAIMENAGLDDESLDAAAQREPSTFALSTQGGY